MELVSILLICGIICIIFTFINRKSDQIKCKPKIIYKYVPENLLDIQFGDKNNPSDIYNDMFLSSSPWIGGFGIGNKTFVNDNIQKDNIQKDNMQKDNMQKDNMQKDNMQKDNMQKDNIQKEIKRKTK